ncbi:MAG TPA: DUF6370 family protein [Fimbriiglobus sp.]|nr:DUF6370 family protein [Fimbriiglobus sp.]
MVRFGAMLTVLTLAAGASADTPKPACCAKCCCAAKADGEKGLAEGKEVKLTGTLVCARCQLKLDGVKKCTNALQVKEGDKTVTYLLDDKGMKEEYHEGVCGGGETKNVTVVGKLTEKDGKKWVKPTKVVVKK